MNLNISSQVLEMLCVEFVKRGEPERISRVAYSCGTDFHINDRCGNRRGLVTGSSFAALLVGFVTHMAADAAFDLRKDWLLHRLQSLVIDGEQLRPGELGMLRADVDLLLDRSGLSQSERDTLHSGFDRIWASLDSSERLATK